MNDPVTESESCLCLDVLALIFVKCARDIH